MPQYVYDRVERKRSGQYVLRTTRLPAPALRLSVPPAAPHLPQPSVPEASLPPHQPGALQAEVEQLWSRVAAPGAPYELRQVAAHGLASKLCTIARNPDQVAHAEGTLRRCGALTPPLLLLGRDAEARGDICTLQVVLSCFANFSYAGLSASLVAQDRGTHLGALLVGVLRVAEDDQQVRHFAVAAAYNLSSEGGVLDALEAGGVVPTLQRFAHDADDADLKRYAQHTLLNLQRRRSLVRAATSARQRRRSRAGCFGLCGSGSLLDEIVFEEEAGMTGMDTLASGAAPSSGAPDMTLSSRDDSTVHAAGPSGGTTSATRDERPVAAATSRGSRDGAASTAGLTESTPEDLPAPETDESIIDAQAAQAAHERVASHMSAARESLSVYLDQERASEEILAISKLAAARASQ